MARVAAAVAAAVVAEAALAVAAVMVLRAGEAALEMESQRAAPIGGARSRPAPSTTRCS